MTKMKYLLVAYERPTLACSKNSFVRNIVHLFNKQNFKITKKYKTLATMVFYYNQGWQNSSGERTHKKF